MFVDQQNVLNGLQTKSVRLTIKLMIINHDFIKYFVHGFYSSEIIIVDFQL